jgi:hypothetical protein
MIGNSFRVYFPGPRSSPIQRCLLLLYSFHLNMAQLRLEKTLIVCSENRTKGVMLYILRNTGRRRRLAYSALHKQNIWKASCLYLLMRHSWGASSLSVFTTLMETRLVYLFFMKLVVLVVRPHYRTSLNVLAVNISSRWYLRKKN